MAAADHQQDHFPRGELVSPLGLGAATPGEQGWSEPQFASPTPGQQDDRRKYFVITGPIVRGLDLDHAELKILKGLGYAILKKDRMAYVYDFG